jgi:hypothetical protein
LGWVGWSGISTNGGSLGVNYNGIKNL